METMDAYAYTSHLRNQNPAFKVLFSIITLFFCILLDKPLVSGTVLICMTYLTVVKSGVPFHEWIGLLKIPLLFVILALLAVMLEFSGQPHDIYVSIGFTYIVTTVSQLQRGCFLFLRIMGSVSAMYFMTLTTPAHELIGVLRKCHIPALVIELMHLIYRYIFILLQTQRRMRISAESRLGFCDYPTSLRSFGSIAGNLLVVSFKQADACYNAMESRCYDGELRFLEEDKPLKAAPIVSAIAFWLVLVLLSTLT